jgi:hypothetical protein
MNKKWNNIFNSYPIRFIPKDYIYNHFTPLFPSGISLSKKNNKKKQHMAASILEEQFDQKHIYFFWP